jgi:hypothetical protein
MGRESASTNRRRTDADLRERYHVADPNRQSRRPGRLGQGQRPPRNTKQIIPPAHATPPSHVIDDFPKVVPVGAQELDVIETYLGAVLNELLGAGQ